MYAVTAHIWYPHLGEWRELGKWETQDLTDAEEMGSRIANEGTWIHRGKNSMIFYHAQEIGQVTIEAKEE